MPDPFDVAHPPLRYIPAPFGSLYLRIGKPRGLVLPAGGKLQREMALPHGISFLEIPDVLQKKGLLLYFIFIANDVSRIGRRHAQYSVPDVGDQFASFERRGKIERVFVLDLVVLAVGWDAPSMQTGDFSARIEIDTHRATLSPFGPQNFIGLAYARPDFVD